MAACDLVLEQTRINVVYNDLAAFLDQDEGAFVIKDFSEVVKLKGGKGVQIIKNNGKSYYFTVNYTNVGQMTSISFRSHLGLQPVMALPIATWNGKPIDDNNRLYELIRDCA